jgi:ABC-2 type transport system ATP-binding protein
MASPIVEARSLTKRFGKVEALSGLDLVADRGQVVAVLGPNGAGKTTLVRTIATLVRPDAGSLRVDGIDVTRHPEQVRRVIGLAGQYAAVEEAMTGRENLHMVARLFGHDRVTAAANADAVLDRLGLGDAADRLVRTYSGGMRRRLDLGASLVGAPRLLLLDEPTTGLDPRSRLELWDAIRALVAHGTDVLLTTQYLDEADQLASQVVIVDHGRVIAEGTPGELKSRAGRDVIEVHAHRADDLAGLAAALAPIGTDAPRVEAPIRRVAVPVTGGRHAVAEAVRALDAAGLDVDDIALRRPTLDEVFLALTGAPVATPPDDPAPDTAPRTPATTAGLA